MGKTVLPELPQTPEFELAAKIVRETVDTFPKPEQRKFYGYYKFGLHGKNPDGPPSGFFQFVESQKWESWDEVSKEKDMTPEMAQQIYVAYLVELRPELKSKLNPKVEVEVEAEAEGEEGEEETKAKPEVEVEAEVETNPQVKKSEAVAGDD